MKISPKNIRAGTVVIAVVLGLAALNVVTAAAAETNRTNVVQVAAAEFKYFYFRITAKRPGRGQQHVEREIRYSVDGGPLQIAIMPAGQYDLGVAVPKRGRYITFRISALGFTALSDGCNMGTEYFGALHPLR